MFEVTASPRLRHAKAILVHARGAACAHAHAHASACACVGFVRPSCLVFAFFCRRQREAATSYGKYKGARVRVSPALPPFPESCVRYPPFLSFGATRASTASTAIGQHATIWTMRVRTTGGDAHANGFANACAHEHACDEQQSRPGRRVRVTARLRACVTLALREGALTRGTRARRRVCGAPQERKKMEGSGSW